VCGATGEVRLDGQPPDVGAVSAMAEATAPRGPDAAGVWSQGRAALGHRRLKIINLSEAGAQPMVAVSKTRLVTHQHLAGPSGCPLAQRTGGWVIHFPVVVCTSSPSTITSLFRPNGRSSARPPVGYW
jgi:hypothetical protein